LSDNALSLRLKNVTTAVIRVSMVSARSLRPASLVPGSFAFRAAIGWLEIMRMSERNPAALQAETLSLLVTAILLATAISVELAIAFGILGKSLLQPGPAPATDTAVTHNPHEHFKDERRRK